jgi:hypothetical protein
MRYIKINEEVETKIISELISEAFYPNVDKVLFIKDYIDKNFKKQSLDDIDTNGYPCSTPSVVMMSKSGQPMKTMEMKEFLLFLDDKFHSMISDESDRKKFLKQVITDWYNNKISKNGLLSVNHLL